MNRIEILAIVMPIVVVASVILAVQIINYLDDRRARTERQNAAPSAAE